VDPDFKKAMYWWRRAANEGKVCVEGRGEEGRGRKGGRGGGWGGGSGGERKRETERERGRRQNA
jgi:hypothetical protein